MAATTDKPVLTETTNTADEPGDVGSPESARSKADDKKKLKAEVSTRSSHDGGYAAIGSMRHSDAMVMAVQLC